MHELAQHITIFGGVGIAFATVMVLALPLTLPRSERKLVKQPLLYLLGHIAIVATRALIDIEEHSTEESLVLLELTLLLLSVARSGYLLLLHVVVARSMRGEVPRILRDLIQAILYGGVAIVVLGEWGVDAGQLLTTSALLTAVIGLSLQDTLGNLFAGLAIQAQRPFRVGDWIQFDDDIHRIGRVLEMNWRAVNIVTLDQVEITVPNSTLAKAPLRNFSLPRPEARRRVYVHAPREVSPANLRAVLLEAVQGVGGVLAKPTPSVLVHEFDERGVKYEVRFFIRDFAHRENLDAEVRERLWYAMQRCGVSIPPPNRFVRMHDMTEERIEHEHEAQIDDREHGLEVVDFLAALEEKVLHKLAEQATDRLYGPGEHVIRQGEEGDELFIVRRGQVKVLVKGRRGRDRELAILGPGDFFGEMGLMTGEMRRATVVATTEAELLVLNKAALGPILAERPELAETISEVLAERANGLEPDEITKVEELPDDEEENPILERIKKFFSLGADDTDDEEFENG